MPIRSHLNGQRFDPETMRVMGLAYEMTLISLRRVDRGDIANNVVAQKLIELAKSGERDPERLCEGVLEQWSRQCTHPRLLANSGSNIEPSVSETICAGSLNLAPTNPGGFFLPQIQWILGDAGLVFP
jgi:hypothetical protein